MFKFLGNVEVFGRKRPLYGTLCLGIAAGENQLLNGAIFLIESIGLVGAFFSEEQLVEVISIGTLCSFVLISCSAIIQRYREKHSSKCVGLSFDVCDWQVSIQAAYHGDLLLQTSAEAISRLPEAKKSDLRYICVR